MYLSFNFQGKAVLIRDNNSEYGLEGQCNECVKAKYQAKRFGWQIFRDVIPEIIIFFCVGTVIKITKLLYGTLLKLLYAKDRWVRFSVLQPECYNKNLRGDSKHHFI